MGVRVRVRVSRTWPETRQPSCARCALCEPTCSADCGGSIRSADTQLRCIWCLTSYSRPWLTLHATLQEWLGLGLGLGLGVRCEGWGQG